MKKFVYSIVLFSVLFGANVVSAMEDGNQERKALVQDKQETARDRRARKRAERRGSQSTSSEEEDSQEEAKTKDGFFTRSAKGVKGKAKTVGSHIARNKYKYAIGTAGAAAGAGIVALIAYDYLKNESAKVKAAYTRAIEILEARGEDVKNNPKVVIAVASALALIAGVTLEAVLRGENSWVRKGANATVDFAKTAKNKVFGSKEVAPQAV